MAEEAPAETKKPRLMDCLERLESLVQELRVSSEEYATVKEAFKQSSATGAVPEGYDLAIIVPGGRSIALPWPGDSQAALGVLDEASASLGGHIADLWGQAQEIVGQAAQICDAAKQRAETGVT